MSKMINTMILTQLADKGTQELAAQYGNLPLDVKQAMKDANDKRRQEVAAAAAGVIIELLAVKEAIVSATAANILSLEKQIADSKVMLANIDKATQYGLNTGNFLPLCKETAQPIQGSPEKDLLSVPTGWTAPAPAATTTGSTSAATGG